MANHNSMMQGGIQKCTHQRCNLKTNQITPRTTLPGIQRDPATGATEAVEVYPTTQARKAGLIWFWRMHRGMVVTTCNQMVVMEDPVT